MRDSGRRTTIALMLVVAMGGIAPIASAGKGDRSRVPRAPHVVDERGDANYAYVVDHVTPVSRAEADVLAAWFTNDRKTITAYWHIAASPVEKDVTFSIRAQRNPNATLPETRVTTRRCFVFALAFPAPSDPWDPYGHAGTRCSMILDVPTTPKMTTLADGSVVVSTTYRLGPALGLKLGDQLDAPVALSGDFTVFPWGGYEPFPQIDMTPVGRDHAIR